jgi:hypothetical protein
MVVGNTRESTFVNRYPGKTRVGEERQVTTSIMPNRRSNVLGIILKCVD